MQNFFRAAYKHHKHRENIITRHTTYLCVNCISELQKNYSVDLNFTTRTCDRNSASVSESDSDNDFFAADERTDLFKRVEETALRYCWYVKIQIFDGQKSDIYLSTNTLRKFFSHQQKEIEQGAINQQKDEDKMMTDVLNCESNPRVLKYSQQYSSLMQDRNATSVIWDGD